MRSNKIGVVKVYGVEVPYSTLRKRFFVLHNASIVELIAATDNLSDAITIREQWFNRTIVENEFVHITELPELFTAAEYEALRSKYHMVSLAMLRNNGIIYPAAWESYIGCDDHGCLYEGKRYFYRLVDQHITQSGAVNSKPLRKIKKEGR